MNNNLTVWIRRVPALFYGLLWMGGVMSYTLWGAPPENVTERCKIISFYHTRNVYKYTCLGLFERHKLLFEVSEGFGLFAAV